MWCFTEAPFSAESKDVKAKSFKQSIYSVECKARDLSECMYPGQGGCVTDPCSDSTAPSSPDGWICLLHLALQRNQCLWHLCKVNLLWFGLGVAYFKGWEVVFLGCSLRFYCLSPTNDVIFLSDLVRWFSFVGLYWGQIIYDKPENFFSPQFSVILPSMYHSGKR